MELVYSHYNLHLFPHGSELLRSYVFDAYTTYALISNYKMLQQEFIIKASFFYYELFTITYFVHVIIRSITIFSLYPQCMATVSFVTYVTTVQLSQ